MDMATRRGGVFLTPLPFAKKACEYLENTLGIDWAQSGNCRLWDMAAGTGHLEMYLPKEFQQYCYLSTLQSEDVQHLKGQFPEATVFQYNYLDDGVEKMPDALQRDLTNPEIKWIILVNPPYATAQEAGLKGTSKEGVADTKIRTQMHAEGLGEVSRELYVQFLYRIVHEFQHRETLLGLFSPLKYLTSANYQKFRDRVFQAAFQSGFLFSSENFGGTSKTSHFPVAFILWKMSATPRPARAQNLAKGKRYSAPPWDSNTSPNIQPPRKGQENQVCDSDILLPLQGGNSHDNIANPGRCPGLGLMPLTGRTLRTDTIVQWTKELQLAILDNAAQPIGIKTVRTENRDIFLSRWIKRPRGTKIFPPFGSALTIKSDNVDTRNRIAEGFLASLMCPGNELQNQQQTAFLSGPQASAGALSVTPENFEQAVIVFAARRIPKDTWINHVDQLLRPNRELSPQFIADCAVWSLFDNKNQTVAMRNVEYQGRIYQITNHFFPFPTAENSFVADWLAEQTLSVEAQAVLEQAREIYRLFFTNWDVLRRAEFKIETYDAGWYQIQKALRDASLGTSQFADLKERHDLLKEAILPQLYCNGIR
jgi:hypothetical protein